VRKKEVTGENRSSLMGEFVGSPFKSLTAIETSLCNPSNADVDRSTIQRDDPVVGVSRTTCEGHVAEIVVRDAALVDRRARQPDFLPGILRIDDERLEKNRRRFARCRDEPLATLNSSAGSARACYGGRNVDEGQ